jgi:hypothetical protein
MWIRDMMGYSKLQWVDSMPGSGDAIAAAEGIS